jgi:hypothetical protein
VVNDDGMCRYDKTTSTNWGRHCLKKEEAARQATGFKVKTGQSIHRLHPIFSCADFSAAVFCVCGWQSCGVSVSYRKA